MVKVYQYEKWDQIQGEIIRSRNKRTADSIKLHGAEIVPGTEQEVPDSSVDADCRYKTPITKAEFENAFSRRCQGVGVEQADVSFHPSGQVTVMGAGRSGEPVTREQLAACNEILSKMLQECIIIDLG